MATLSIRLQTNLKSCPSTIISEASNVSGYSNVIHSHNNREQTSLSIRSYHEDKSNIDICTTKPLGQKIRKAGQ